jgi:hypothetical protein
MDYRQDDRLDGRMDGPPRTYFDPPSPYSGYSIPREEIELLQSPHSNTHSPRPYLEENKNQIPHQYLQEPVPHYATSSEQDLVHPGLGPACKPTPWRPGFFTRFPWLGFAALILSLMCMAGGLFVLVSSNQQPVTSWTLQPTVILAILSAVFNASLAFALAQGAEISWWYA